jgi:Condensation domain
MPIKVNYRGYDLVFEQFPTAQDLQLAYEAVQVQIKARIREPEYEPIQKVSRDGAIQLSFAQEWLWWLDQFEPGSAVYNLPSAVRIAGRLNVSALIRSIGEIVRRHEVLRSVFREVDGQPAQFIQDSKDFTVPMIDLSLITPPARETTARNLLSEEVSLPCDLASGPIIRSSLIRVDDLDHIVIITIHHIAFDAWSAGILMKELIALYGAFSKGEESPLAEPKIQYADYASWQRNSLSDELLAKQLAYWKRQLSGAPAVLDLPVDRTRPLVPSHRGARQSISLSATLSDAVRRLARQEGATLFMVLLAALNTLLARLSGQNDISVGMPIAGRGRVELEGLIGCFINTLVLRTRLAPKMTFRDLLRNVRETTLEAYEHQDLPFAKLIAELKPERRVGYMPLYQVLLDVVNAPSSSDELSDLTFSPLTSDQGTAKVDLILDVWDSASGIMIMTEYKTDLFDRETIARMLRQFETLLGSIVAQPETRLSALEIISDIEKQQQIIEQSERAENRRRRFVNTSPKPFPLSQH